MSLCQAIPLAIDLITRLIGINVGKRVKDIVARISKKIRGVIDKLINKLNHTKLGQKFTQATGKKIPTFKERKRSKKDKEDREKQQVKDTKRVRKREKTRKDNMIAATTATMGNWGTQLSDYVSDRKKAQSNKVFNVTGLTSALKGEKEGDPGINLDNSKYVTTTSERNAQKIDQYFENRKAEKLRLAEREAQKKRIAETHENWDNNEGDVLALPSEQVDENHVAAQQSDASEEQDSRVVAEQRPTSEQVDESNLEVRQSGAAEEQDNSRVVAEQTQPSNQVEAQQSDASGNNDVLHVVAERTQTSEQVDENHVAAQQAGDSAEQDPHVVAEQTQTSNQVDESNVEVRQSDASEEQDNPLVVAEQTQRSDQVDESNVEVRQSGAAEAHAPLQEANANQAQQSIEPYTGGRTEDELEALARDPAHSNSQREIDIQKGREEARIGLDLERLGLLDGIVRDPTGRAEFIDKNGQKWDIKSFNSNYSPKKGGFTLQKAIQSINRSLSENENVIVNTTQMKDNDLEKLKQEVNALGIRDKVIFWPL